MTLRQFHDDFAWVVVVANAVVGAVGPRGPLAGAAAHPWLWWCTAVAEITIFVAGGGGRGHRGREDIEAPQFHTFYGFVALVTVGIVYSYRQQLAQWRYLLYGAAGCSSWAWPSGRSPSTAAEDPGKSGDRRASDR